MIEITFKVSYTYDHIQNTFKAQIRVQIPCDCYNQLPIFLRSGKDDFFGFKLTSRWGYTPSYISSNSLSYLYSIITLTNIDTDILDRQVRDYLEKAISDIKEIYDNNRIVRVPKDFTKNIVLK